jgi:peptidoglycan/LPS O-acetylase OafA/YrhL
MIHWPALRDLISAVAGGAMVAAASPGAPGVLVAVAAVAVLAQAATTVPWPGTAAAVICVLMVTTGHAVPIVAGGLVLGYLLLSDRGVPRLQASAPVIGGALLATLAATAAGLIGTRPSVWLVLAVCAALPVAVALAIRLPAEPSREADRNGN